MDELTNKLYEKLFNAKMEVWALKHTYENESIIKEIDDNLLAVNNYYTKTLRDLIVEFGFEKVEKYFIDKKGETNE